MADTYIKVNTGDKFRVDHDVAAAAEGLYVEGTKVVGTQEAFISGTPAGTDAAIIQDILDVLVAHGLTAAS